MAFRRLASWWNGSTETPPTNAQQTTNGTSHTAANTTNTENQNGTAAHAGAVPAPSTDESIPLVTLTTDLSTSLNANYFATADTFSTERPAPATTNNIAIGNQNGTAAHTGAAPPTSELKVSISSSALATLHENEAPIKTVPSNSSLSAAAAAATITSRSSDGGADGGVSATPRSPTPRRLKNRKGVNTTSGDFSHLPDTTALNVDIRARTISKYANHAKRYGAAPTREDENNDKTIFVREEVSEAEFAKKDRAIVNALMQSIDMNKVTSDEKKAAPTQQFAAAGNQNNHHSNDLEDKDDDYEEIEDLAEFQWVNNFSKATNDSPEGLRAAKADYIHTFLSQDQLSDAMRKRFGFWDGVVVVIGIGYGGANAIYAFAAPSGMQPQDIMDQTGKWMNAMGYKQWILSVAGGAASCFINYAIAIEFVPKAVKIVLEKLPKEFKERNAWGVAALVAELALITVPFTCSSTMATAKLTYDSLTKPMVNGVSVGGMVLAMVHGVGTAVTRFNGIRGLPTFVYDVLLRNDTTRKQDALTANLYEALDHPAENNINAAALDAAIRRDLKTSNTQTRTVTRKVDGGERELTVFKLDATAQAIALKAAEDELKKQGVTLRSPSDRPLWQTLAQGTFLAINTIGAFSVYFTFGEKLVSIFPTLQDGNHNALAHFVRFMGGFPSTVFYFTGGTRYILKVPDHLRHILNHSESKYEGAKSLGWLALNTAANAVGGMGQFNAGRGVSSKPGHLMHGTSDNARYAYSLMNGTGAALVNSNSCYAMWHDPDIDHDNPELQEKSIVYAMARYEQLHRRTDAQSATFLAELSILGNRRPAPVADAKTATAATAADNATATRGRDRSRFKSQ